jgi:hypothetical protein
MASIVDFTGNEWLLRLIDLRRQGKISQSKFNIEFEGVYDIRYSPKKIPEGQTYGPKLESVYYAILAEAGEPEETLPRDRVRGSVSDVLNELFGDFDFSPVRHINVPL